MAKFRSNHQRSSGAGTIRLIVWVLAMAAVLVALFFLMKDLGS